MKTTALYIVLSSALFFAACDVSNSDMDPSDSFMRIYDDEDINTSYYPLDFKQTDDGGFVIVASRDYDTNEYVWQRAYILKTNSSGDFDWEYILPEPYVSPVPELVVTGSSVAFFCMDRTTLGTYLLSVDMGNEVIQQIERYDNLKYPVYATQDASDLLLMNYERIPGNSVFTKVNAGTLNVNYSIEYSGFFADDVEDQVISHLSRRGKQYPFFIQTMKNSAEQTTGYSLNTFYNYSFAMLFVNAQNGIRKGVLSGYQYNTYTSAAVQLNDTLFALSKTEVDRVYVNSQLALHPSETDHINNIDGIRFRELRANSKLLLKKFELAGRELFVYCGSTQANQLALYYFDTENGLLIATKYLGSTYPVEVAGLLKTNEGGLAILFKASVLGKFDRIGVYKLAPGQLGL